MRRQAIMAATALAVMATSAPALARTINGRQATLQHRINMGIHNGSLTRAEARRLQREYFRIAWRERQYRRNGLNGWERSDINRRLDRLSRQIRYDRHDDQNRWDNSRARSHWYNGGVYRR